jgi:hypothetical protein
MAKRRHVSLNYFSDMGQTAYFTIGELERYERADLYIQLAEQFLTLQHILRAMRGECVELIQSTEQGIIPSGKWGLQ